MLPRPDRMYAGDGAGGEDHACSDRLTSAGEDIQGSRQAVMNSAGQVVGGSFSHEFPVDVAGELDRTPPGRSARTEPSTRPLLLPKSAAITVGPRELMSGIGLLATSMPTSSCCSRSAASSAVQPPVVGGQILTQPNDQLCFHGREPGREDPDLGWGYVLLAEVILPTPDGPDQPVRIPGRAPVRRDVADLPADQRVLPSRHRQLLDLVGLGHAGGDHTREPSQAPPLSGSDQLGGDYLLSCRCAHLDRLPGPSRPTAALAS